METPTCLQLTINIVDDVTFRLFILAIIFPLCGEVRFALSRYILLFIDNVERVYKLHLGYTQSNRNNDSLSKYFS